MSNVTKIYLCWNLYQQGVSPEKIPEIVGKHRATVYRWIKGIQFKGFRNFLTDYKQAKQGHRHRRTDALIKLHIYKIRREKRGCCGDKIKYFLRQDYGEKISVSTIYRVLNQKYILRSRWKKNCKRGRVLKGKRKGEVVQVDTVDLGSLYAFTAIDTYTREATVVLKKRLTACAGKEALIDHLQFFGKIERIQRDGGSEFKAEWQQKARISVQGIRTARPYKKNEQAFIERFNGILRKECVGYLKYKHRDLEELQKRVDEFLRYYNYERPHLSLNMQTPHQFAMSHLT